MHSYILSSVLLSFSIASGNPINWFPISLIIVHGLQLKNTVPTCPLKVKRRQSSSVQYTDRYQSHTELNLWEKKKKACDCSTLWPWTHINRKGLLKLSSLQRVGPPQCLLVKRLWKIRAIFRIAELGTQNDWEIHTLPRLGVIFITVQQGETYAINYWHSIFPPRCRLDALTFDLRLLDHEELPWDLSKRNSYHSEIPN